MKNKPITIAGAVVNPGEKKILVLPGANLYTQSPMNIPIHIIHGKKAGPRLFVIAAVHGDEINGIEIVRRLLKMRLRSLQGTLIAIPVANVYGFMTLSRYLPDRRDLNRAFPGYKSGSFTSRLAHFYMEEIISKCTHGIDLHSGNVHSENLPHIRANLDVPGALEMAKHFKIPVVINARLRDGSIRQAATELNIPVLVYEGGEALRFNEVAIKIGLRGIVNILRGLKMLKLPHLVKLKRMRPRISHLSLWARAPRSGIFYQQRSLGSDVEAGEKLGFIADPFSKKETELFSPIRGIIIGRTTLPLVNEGDALIHVAKIKGKENVTTQIGKLQHYFIENEYNPF